MGPGLVSTSPATNSNKNSARHSKKRGVTHPLTCRYAQHWAWLTSFPRKERAPFPTPHASVATFLISESSSRVTNRGASDISPGYSETRGRDPQCALYHRSFLFSQWPILARHSSGPLGGMLMTVKVSRDCVTMVCVPHPFCQIITRYLRFQHSYPS